MFRIFVVMYNLVSLSLIFVAMYNSQSLSLMFVMFGHENSYLQTAGSFTRCSATCFALDASLTHLVQVACAALNHFSDILADTTFFVNFGFEAVLRSPRCETCLIICVSTTFLGTRFYGVHLWLWLHCGVGCHSL